MNVAAEQGYHPGDNPPVDGQPIRVGILGAGMMGIAHADAYRAAGAQIVGVVDTDAARGADLAGKLNCATYPSPTDLLAARIDAVSVCLPHALHLSAARLAADHGVHVLMEKPLATTMQEGQAIVEVCERAGVKLMVGFIQRFFTGVRDLQSRLAAGQLGRVGLAVEHLAAGGVWPVLPAWYRQRAAAGGGIVMMGLSHAVDRLRWLLDDEVEAVYGVVGQIGREGDVEDRGSAVLRYRSGAQATLVGMRSPLSTHQRRWTLDLYGETAEAMLTFQASNDHSLALTTAEGTEVVEHPAGAPFRAEIDEFLAAIRADREPTPGGCDGLIALATVMAIYASAETGQPVELPRDL